jgi:hypothetical protein
VALVRIDVSEEHIASIISETYVLTGATRCHNKEDGILHSHRCENLKSYIPLHLSEYLQQSLNAREYLGDHVEMKKQY